MAPFLEAAAAAAGEDDREVVVVVAVGVTDAAAVDDHAVVEEGAVAFGEGFEFLEEVGKLGAVKLVDAGDFFEFFGIALVVGDAVVGVGDADIGEAAIGTVVGEEEGGDAGGVGLEGEDLEVEHQADVVLVVVGDAGGLGVIGEGLGELGGVAEAALDVADGGEVLVEFLFVGGAELALEGLGVFEDEVEDALVVEFALGAGGVFFGAVAAGEEALEGELGVALGGEGRGFAFPGQVELIGTGIAAVAVAGAAGFVAAEFEGGKAGELAEVFGGDLVDGNAVADVGAGGFAGLDAGEEAGVSAGVVAAAVAIGLGLFVFEAGDDLEVGLEVLEGSEGAAEGVVAAVLAGGPVSHVFAVGRVDEGDAEGGLAAGFGGANAGAGGEGGGGFEGGQGHEGAEAAEKAAARKVGGHGEQGVQGKEGPGEREACPRCSITDEWRGRILSTGRNASGAGSDAALRGGEIGLGLGHHVRPRILHRSCGAAPRPHGGRLPAPRLYGGGIGGRGAVL